MSECKWCRQEFTSKSMAGHSRWCSSNPSYLETREKSRKSVAAMNAAKAKSGSTNQFSKAKLQGKTFDVSEETRKKLSIACEGRKHTPETIEKIRQKALASDHRRLKKGVVEYNGVLMDSSWEVRLAKSLDEANIEWLRPSPIRYELDGVNRKYFPDFYLPEYDLYVDPKNQHAYNVQVRKIKVLLENIKNLVFLTSLEEIDTFVSNIKRGSFK